MTTSKNPNLQTTQAQAARIEELFTERRATRGAMAAGSITSELVERDREITNAIRAAAKSISEAIGGMHFGAIAPILEGSSSKWPILRALVESRVASLMPDRIKFERPFGAELPAWTVDEACDRDEKNLRERIAQAVSSYQGRDDRADVPTVSYGDFMAGIERKRREAEKADAEALDRDYAERKAQADERTRRRVADAGKHHLPPIHESANAS